MIQWRNTSCDYGAISLFLHWLMAPLVMVMLALGWGREFVPGYLKPAFMTAHTSIGIIFLGLVMIRVVWRWHASVPTPPHDMPFGAKFLAHAAHMGLYCLMLVLPLSGWLILSAMGHGPSFLGLGTLPALVAKTPAWVPIFKNFHEIMAYGIALLVIAHIGAALLHHFVLKDDILYRMLPGLKIKADPH